MNFVVVETGILRYPGGVSAPTPPPMIPAEPYVSNFPGTAEVRVDRIFSAPGYNQARPHVPAIITFAVITNVLSWLLPPFSWTLTSISLPISIIAFRLTHTRYRYNPGQQAAFGSMLIAGATVAAGLAWLVIWGLSLN